MPHLARILSLLVPLALAACDSSSLYSADLGQQGPLPAVDAMQAAAPGGVQGEALEFVAPSGGSLPSDWRSAQSVKVDVGGTFVPMVTGTVGASSSFEAIVPSTLGFVAPPKGTVQAMAFEIDQERVMVAEVKF